MNHLNVLKMLCYYIAAVFCHSSIKFNLMNINLTNIWNVFNDRIEIMLIEWNSIQLVIFI